jgi:PAS domain S-box-containing protein/putative nucleotidyltransferase with HDIG domain
MAVKPKSSIKPKTPNKHKTAVKPDKKMEATMYQSEERYRTILDEMADAYFEVDIAGNYTFVNDSCCSHLGYTKKELIGTSFRGQMAKEEFDKVYKAFGNIYITGKPERGIFYKLIRKDGTTGFAELAGFPLQNPKGEVIGFRGVGRDITERRQMEEALQQSEEKYRTIIENIQDGYFEVDLAGTFTFFNESLREIHGYPKEELMGMNHRQYADKENAKKVFDAFNEIFKTGITGSIFEYEIIRKDGTRRQIEVSASLKKDSSDKPIGFRGTARDITERKRAEETLRKSEEKYRTVLENMHDGYFEIDLAGRFTFVNDAMCRIAESTRERLIGMSNLQYTDETTAKKLYEVFSGIYRTGEPVSEFAFEFTRRGGTRAFTELSVSLIRDAEGKPIGFRGISRDVTERKQAEEELQQTLDSLRNAVGTTIQVMVSAVEMRDPYTAGHQIRVADLARAIATEMGLPKDKIDGIRMAGSIHDIGKLSVPAEILTKPTKLSDIEFSLIKEHSRSGYEMLKDVESPWPLAEIVYQHHERMNGSGYPRNLKGNEILMEARIMAVADVVESMASHRPYRPALGIEAALEEIEKNKGIFYDDAVADACLRLFREKGYQLP